MTSIYGKFKNMEPCRIQQEFDKEKIFVERCGEKINCFDAIQAANVDTNIYEVMKKYHCQVDEATELMQRRGGTQGIYADIVEMQENIKDFGDIKKVFDKANKLFEELPSEIKDKYGNNLEEFFKDQEKIAKQQKATEQAKKSEVSQDETK